MTTDEFVEMLATQKEPVSVLVVKPGNPARKGASAQARLVAILRDGSVKVIKDSYGIEKVPA